MKGVENITENANFTNFISSEIVRPKSMKPKLEQHKSVTWSDVGIDVNHKVRQKPTNAEQQESCPQK